MANAPRDAVIPDAPKWNISVVSELVITKGYLPNYKLGRQELATAHWCVMDNCWEAELFIAGHRDQLNILYPHATEEQRIASFIPHFRHWVGTHP